MKNNKPLKCRFCGGKIKVSSSWWNPDDHGLVYHYKTTIDCIDCGLRVESDKPEDITMEKYNKVSSLTNQRRQKQ
ncbi:MAG: hypothetical protein PHH77_05195 [Victivallaceae bacterium]|nr:hypothetical protein [Victivallaceae bacterium]